MEWSKRACTVLVSALMTSASVSAATPIVTANDAVRMFLDEHPDVRRTRAAERAAHAAFSVERRIANPEIAYEVERAGGTRDELLTVTQALPVTGRQRVFDVIAASAASAAALTAESRVGDRVREVRSVFHEVIYLDRYLETVRDAEDALARTVEVLERRERAGEGSGYDLLRVEQEQAELRWTIAEVEAALVEARARFGGFFAPSRAMHRASLEGSLSAATPVPDDEAAIASALEQRADLRALSAARARHESEIRAAKRSRFPEPVVTAGWKRTGAPGIEDTGYVAAVSVPLPLFRRGRVETALATAAADRVELEAEALRRTIRGEVLAALARERAAREAVERYGVDAERRAATVERIARLRYDEGEGSIVELLDAHRASRSTRLRTLAARYRAKLAEIDRDRVLGNEVNP